MLRDLLVRVSAGLLGAALAVGCTREEQRPREDVGTVQQAATLAGQGGADGADVAAADLGGAPAVGQAGAPPETCDPATCEGPGRCTRCVGNQCVRFTAADNHTCRPADASGCDVADVCDGTTDSCPDAVASSTTKCRDAAGLCDVDDFCNGTTKVCGDAKRVDGFVCRDAVATGCDVADTCDGVSNACPDVVRSSATKCRDAAAGGCDVDDFCDGVTSACADAKRPVNYQCRAAVLGGCDVADLCDGSTNACPDVVAPRDTQCRAAAGPCDLPDFCDGASTACADAKQAANVVCNPDDGLGCDLPDVCDGLTNGCAVVVKAAGVTCRAAAGSCDVADVCSGTTTACVDSRRAAGSVCRPADVAAGCDVQEVCDGLDPQCPADGALAIGTECRAKAGDCDVAEFCNGTTVCPPNEGQPDGAQCADAKDKCFLTFSCQAGECQGQTAKTCAQTEQCKTNACVPQTGNCAFTNKANNTVCDDQIACTGADRCVSGSCVGTPTNSLCAKPEHKCGEYTCDPSVNPAEFPDYCRMTPLAKGTPCRGPNGICGLAESCDGETEDCPADLHKDASFVCQPASCVGSVAKPEITCAGTATCPTQPDVTCQQFACDAATKTCGVTCVDDTGCQPDHYCVGGTCEERINPGGKCTDDTQCEKSNPFCVDGVCCNTLCKEQCEACDVEGKLGTCSPVEGEPHGERKACLGDGSSCRGVCDGQVRSACQYPARSVQCLAATCDPMTSTALEQAFCDGTGNCARLGPMECTPYRCGATACRGDCVTDAQCAAGAFCRAGVCEARQEDGAKCTRDGQCDSGFCTDGVCCEGRCDGQCEACDRAGACVAVRGAPVGARPACAGEAGDACAGECDGARRATCVYPAGEVRCRDASCSAGKATVVAHCTGNGSCAAAQTVTCPSGCEGAVCAGDACLVNDDCKVGERCLAGTCAPRGENGAACGSAGDCDSGFCVDGVCCDRACEGQCEACDDAKQPGVCSPVSGAPHGSRVPCTTDGSACGGACDGKSPDGCRYPSGTACGRGACSLGEDGGEAVATVEAQCNGSGRCPAPRQQACGADGCDADGKLCNGDCADGRACATGQFCSAGVCVDTQPTGTACQASSECASGFCVDGYCCGSACDDRCAACDVPGSLGTCSPVSGNTHGGRAGCRGGGVCGAQCDGKNVTDCAFAAKGTECGAGYCSSGAQVGESACDGAGQCQPGEAIACASFNCDGVECSDACETDADCTRSLQCRAGKCTEPYKIDAVDEGTCGCRAPGHGRSGQGAAWLALGAALSVAWRRRASRRARAA